MQRGLVVVLLALLALVGAGAGSSSPTSPALRLLTRQPVAVLGLHFKPLERVTVTLVAAPVQTSRVAAGRTGSFTVTFDRPLLNHCGAVAVRAVGARGSVATLKIPLFACIAQ